MGPLAGIKIIELAGIGPSPMCAMLLADLGATVLRIDRPEKSNLGIQRPLEFDLVLRNRKVVQIDIKSESGLALVKDLIDQADALIEGFRPGVVERMGLGPDGCLERNPKLVYGRVTGWGQTGPLANSAGHDLNYIAVTGVLDAIGQQGEAPTVPLNLVGDYGGGALYLALGLLAGILEARSSGKGQVVDAAMIDGVASLATLFYGMVAAGMHSPQRGTNILDGGAPFYSVYECADGKWVSVGAIEPKFYEKLLDILCIAKDEIGNQHDRAAWPLAKTVLAAKFKTRSRDEWAEIFNGTDACFSPVLNFEEALDYPQLKDRSTFVEVAGIFQPAPAPRFSRTPCDVPNPPSVASSANTDAALAPWLSDENIADLRKSGTLL
jgi:alpha-methylacyl-CoA racemase